MILTMVHVMSGCWFSSTTCTSHNFITNEHWFTVVLCICHIDKLYQCGWLASYTLICFLPGKFTNWHFFLTSLQTDWWLNHGYFLLLLLICRHCCLQSVIAMWPLGLVLKSFLVSLQIFLPPFVSITQEKKKIS